MNNKSVRKYMLNVLLLSALFPLLVSVFFIFMRIQSFNKERVNELKASEQSAKLLISNHVNDIDNFAQILISSHELQDFVSMPEVTRNFSVNLLYGRIKSSNYSSVKLVSLYIYDENKKEIYKYQDSKPYNPALLSEGLQYDGGKKYFIFNKIIKYDDQNFSGPLSITKGNLILICDVGTWLKSHNVNVDILSVPSEIKSLEDINIKVKYPPAVSAKYIYSYVLILLFVLLACLFISLYIVQSKIIRPIENLTKEVMKRTNEKYLPGTANEIKILDRAFNKYVEFETRLKKQLIEQSRLASIGQTTAIIAHDIRRPFSLLKSILKLFDVFKKDPSELDKAKTEIERALVSVESMLSNIMDFSKEIKLEAKPISFVNIVDFSIRQAARDYNTDNITFKYDFQSTRKLFIDEEQISRAISNIIENAMEAIAIIGEKNIGTIFIRSQDIGRNDKKFTEVVIGNDGPLLDESDIPRLFDSFFTKGKKRGIGLGLASVKKIVEQHGGSVSAKNMTNGKGVEFIINIPASDEHDEIKTDALPRNIKEAAFVESKRDRDEIDKIIDELFQKQKQFKVLLLENEALYRASVKNTVRRSESLTKMLVLYDVSTVEEALELIEQENITHTIVDIDLGQKRDGFDFIKEIKEKYPQILCMVHSNRHLEKDKIKAKELGVKAYVPKPLSIEHLVLFLLDTE